MFDDLVAAQDRLLTRRQALIFMTQSALTARLGRDWQIILPGVYATFTGPLSARHTLRAALLHAGESGMFSDLTALRLYGVTFLPVDSRARVLVASACQKSSRDYVVVRRTIYLPESRSISGFKVAPIARALVDFIARHPVEREGFAVLAAAVQQRRTRLADVASLLAEAPNRGKPKVIRSIERLDGGIRSVAEADFSNLVATSSVLPQPLWNCLLRLPGGELISPDALWAEAGLVHEVNGRRYHADDDGKRDLFDEMQRRHDLLTAAGLVVLHNAPARLRTNGGGAIAQVESCYLRGLGRGLPAGVEIVRAAVA
jgi:hypothetical protein